MLRIKPPTHSIDGNAVYISAADPAWDLDKLKAERDAQVAAALAAKRDDAPEADRDAVELTADEVAAAAARAPVERYYVGKTRYQPSAADWSADGSPTTARAYLRSGEKPAEFVLRRLGFRAYQEIVETENPRARLIEACRLGLRSITADGYKWKATGDEPAGDEQIEALHEASPSLVTEIGGAVLLLSRPLDVEAETPRSGSSRIASA